MSDQYTPTTNDVKAFISLYLTQKVLRKSVDGLANANAIENNDKSVLVFNHVTSHMSPVKPQ